MRKIIAVVNQKGGVGKTTTAINLSAGFALEGIPSMLIDCDPQSNSTGGLGFARDEDRSSTYTVLINESTVAEAAIETGIENLKLLPSSKHLIGANVSLSRQKTAPTACKRLWRSTKARSSSSFSTALPPSIC